MIGAYNLNWKTLQPVKEQIEAALGIPFVLDNDANVAALGERRQGVDIKHRYGVYDVRNRCRRWVNREGKLLHGAAGRPEKSVILQWIPKALIVRVVKKVVRKQ